jgi:2-polyprenyl-6-methoxyphenol hydroxylase-like FAD-dependent oxidoreductase
VSRVTGEHAVVLGGSIAGLLAARVLTDHYRRVTLVERDVLPLAGEQRRGVPQSRHLHALQPSGRRILDELFEGFAAEMIGDGALTGDVLGNVRWILTGNKLAQADIGLPGLFSSRAFLEAHIRARVLALPNVTVRDGTDVLSLTTDGDRISGVRVMANCRDSAARETAHGDEETIAADLVVDATGRGSRTPIWLEQLGYERPEAERVEIDVWYATRMFRLRPGAMDKDLLVAVTPTATVRRSGVMALQEGDEALITLVGRGEQPPLDGAGFEDYAATLALPDIAEALRGAEPLGEAVRFRFPASVRHRYERLSRVPDRLLVIGDAMCSFNPVYGQGMAVAATEAAELRDLLAGGTVPTPRTWFRRASSVIDTPWQVAVGADLADPTVPGKRSRMVKLVNAYLPKVHIAAAADASIAASLIRVMSMVDQPTRLFAPGLVLRVLRTARRAQTQKRTEIPLAGLAEGPVGGVGRRP